jgi:hypothetical protein
MSRDTNRTGSERQINPTGKSLRIFRNHVKLPNQIYYAFVVGQISASTPAVLSRGGALAIVTNVGTGCGGRGSVAHAGDRRAR